MDSEGSVTMWIKEVKAGKEEAARLLWERYFARLVSQARYRLVGRRSADDEEDIALDTFENFYRRASEGDLSRVATREDLWTLLLGVLRWKARDNARKEGAGKRGGGRVRGEAILEGLEDSGGERGIEQVAARQAAPDDMAEMAEEAERLLALLGGASDSLRRVAEWKMQGHTSAEIATMLNCSEKSVERKLGNIRKIWLGEFDRDEGSEPGE